MQKTIDYKSIPQEKLSHSDLYKWVSQTLERLDKKRVTDAFLYSLSSRDLKYRPHIANYIFLKSIPTHDLVESSNEHGAKWCDICSYYVNAVHRDPHEECISYLNPWIEKWGGIWGDNVWEAVYFLDKFLEMPLVKPAKEDFGIFKELMHVVEGSDDNARPRDLEKAFSKIIKSNKGQRDMLIDVLGRISLLETEKHKGYLFKYTLPEDREIPRVYKIDWLYPVSWWRGKNGINKTAYDFLFGEYPELM